MAYQMVATAVTLNDLEGHSPVADVFRCNPLNICAAFYTISTDIVLAWFLWISRASLQQLSQKTAIIFQLMQRVARFLCNSRTSCYSMLQSQLCKRCICYGKSVCLSVHHTPVLCQKEGMQRDAVFTVWQPTVSSFLMPRMVDGGGPCPGKI